MYRILFITASIYHRIAKQISKERQYQIEVYDIRAGVPNINKDWGNYSNILLSYALDLKNESGLKWLQIMSTYPHIPPIILLDHRSNAQAHAHALKFGANDYFTHADYSIEKLCAKIKDSIQSVYSDRVLQKPLQHKKDRKIFDITKAPEKSLQHTDEQQIFDITKAPEGSQHTDEQQIFNITKAPEGSQHIDEQQIFNITKAPEESLQHTDGQKVFNITKAPEESLQHTDGQKVFNITKAPEEPLQHTDGQKVFNITKPPDINSKSSRKNQTSLSQLYNLAIPGYQLQEKIGSGGMASAFKANRIKDNVTIVLKILLNSEEKEPNALKRFIREYKLISPIKNKHIVEMYEIGFGEGFTYIALEYLPLAGLTERIKDGLSPETALSYLKQIAKGLIAIHEQDIIHRDLKPGNILFSDEKTLKIIDFGLASRTFSMNSTQTEDLTVTGFIIGTPHYMSPEQCLGWDVDTRSDIYSLGIIFYVMLTGKKPVRAKNFLEFARAHTNENIAKLPNQYKKYQPLLDRMMAKDPAKRFQKAQDIVRAISINQL